MNYIRSFFSTSNLPCTIETLFPPITPTPTQTQFEYATSPIANMSLSHLFVLNPSHYQFSALLATKSTLFSLSRESSATQFRVVHSFKQLTYKFFALHSKKDGPFAQNEVVFNRPSFQLNLKQVLPSFDNRQIFVFSFLKSINGMLCLGAETVYDGRGIGGSIFGRLDYGAILYGRVCREEVRVGIARKAGMFTLLGEMKFGERMNSAFGVKLETRKASVHVGVEDMKGKVEVEQRMGQGIVMKIGSEIDLGSGNQTVGIALNLEN